MSQSNKKTTIFLVSFFIILSAVFMGYFYKTTRVDEKKLPVIGPPGHHVREFAFINQDGKTITNADVKGKIYVAEYFFATCKGICPKMNENMNTVYEAFKGKDNVLILSHTVDPEKDTVQALKEYSRRFDANASQWMFLTGDKTKLYEAARKSYLINAEDTVDINTKEDFIHDNHFVLVDGDGYLRGVYDGLNKGEVAALIGDIKVLLKEKKD